MMNKFGLSLLTMFGIGHIKYAPGTIASFITCLIYYFLFSIDVNFYYFFLIFLILLIYSIILIDKLSHHFKEKDPKEIVIDEFFGQCIPLISLTVTGFNFEYILLSADGPTLPGVWAGIYLLKSWYYGFNVNLMQIGLIYIVLSFVIFRFFDIFKPYPINIVDKKFKNGFGVMMDDIIAGIYTAIVIGILMFFFIK